MYFLAAGTYPKALSNYHSGEGWTTDASRSAFQAQGSSRASSCALVRPETTRSSTSVSHARGSMPLSFAVAIRLATIAHQHAPPSDPANKVLLRPSPAPRPRPGG